MSEVTESSVPLQETIAAFTLSSLLVSETFALKENVIVSPINPTQSLPSIICAIPNFLFAVSTSSAIAYLPFVGMVVVS